MTGVVILIAIACIVYIPGASRLAPMDDAEIENLTSSYSSVSKAAAGLVSSAFKSFGANVNAFYSWGVISRCLAGLLLWTALFLIWPTERAAAFTSGLYFVLYPGFLQQTSAVEFFPHQIAITFFALSLALMAASFFVKSNTVKAVFTVLSVAAGIYNLLLMETFIGLEVMRLLFIIMFCYMYTPGEISGLFKRACKLWIPWLCGIVIFIVLRNTAFVPVAQVIQEGEEAAAAASSIVGFSNVKPGFLTVLCELVRNVGKTTYGAWFVTVHQLIDGLSIEAFWPLLLRTLFVVAIYFVLVQIYWNLGGPVNERHDDPEHPFEYPREPRFLLWQAQWLIIAAASMVFILLPYIFAGHNVILNSANDWFALPCGLAGGMFIAGTMFQLRVRNYEWPMMVCMVGLGAIAQIAKIFA